ncbi:MAG TPA: cobalamin biosynthesis protein CobW, partial [Alphaproteobacteria bacterium]|nr:cobalamin biosynthesis protein CobW [Alphaproteobacteria bacterium]
SEGRFAADEAAVQARRREDAMLDHDTPLGELFTDQLTAADLVVVNKTDLVSPAALGEVEAMLRARLRPGTGLIRAANGHVSVDALLGLGLATEEHLAGRESLHELEHNGEGHEHDDFDSFCVTLPAAPAREALLAAIERTIRDHDVLRLKGFAALPGAPARLAIQAVGPRVTAWFDRPWRPDERRETTLVVIGESPLDRATIEASLMRAAAVAA